VAHKPTARKKPNKAAFARALAEAQAQPKTRELPAALVGVIDAHQPNNELARIQMDRIRPFLHDAITASALQGAESVRKHCTHLVELAVYALGRGTDLSVRSVLTTAIIDEYVRVGMAEESDHLRAERRRRLLALARTANPGPEVPQTLTPIPHSSVKPCYTPAELAIIKRACHVQPTEARRRDLASVVALGAGAGLDSVDLRDLFTEHLQDDAEDGILVHVQGPRPRIVPVRVAFEDLLRGAIAGRADGGLIGTKQDRRNTAARAVERAALHNVPHIEPSRLRATWLADLMTDPIPIAVILQAAGLKSARTLSELQPHLDAWAAHKGLSGTATRLRGAIR
jgi:hypothetical protein